jgi:hypothetical protein
VALEQAGERAEVDHGASMRRMGARAMSPLRSSTAVSG